MQPHDVEKGKFRIAGKRTVTPKAVTVLIDDGGDVRFIKQICAAVRIVQREINGAGRSYNAIDDII